MSNFKIKQPSDFGSHQAWIDADDRKSYRQKINKAKSELEREQKRYTKLEKQKRKLYSGSSDFEKTQQVKEDLEQCEQNIENLQKEISNLQEKAEKAERNKQELKLAFLEDASQYMDEVLEEFLSQIDKTAKLYDTVRLFSQFDDLRIPGIDSECIHYWRSENRNGLMEGFKQRYEDLQNGFEPRELQKLKSNN